MLWEGQERRITWAKGWLQEEPPPSVASGKSQARVGKWEFAAAQQRLCPGDQLCSCLCLQQRDVSCWGGWDSPSWGQQGMRVRSSLHPYPCPVSLGAPGELQGQQAAEWCDPSECLRATCESLCLWENPKGTFTLVMGPQAPDIHSREALGSVNSSVLVTCPPYSLSFWGAGPLHL